MKIKYTGDSYKTLGTIKNFKEFEEFQNFFADFYNHLGPKPGKNYSVDRINNDKGYERGNIRWATRKEQSIDTRRNLKFIFNNEEYKLPKLCEQENISYRRFSKIYKNHREISIETIVRFLKETKLGTKFKFWLEKQKQK